MISYIDSLLNRITMYRLVLYYLIVLIVVAIVFAGFGLLPYSWLAILTSAVVATAACWVANESFAWAFDAAPNVESVYITALILALIVPPAEPTSLTAILFVVWASVLAMASKYILTIGKKHIFNPAAIAVVITAYAFNDSASWWVGGNVPLMAFVIIGGLLVVRKTQRFDLVLSFLLVAFATIAIHSLPESPWDVAQKIVLHTPIFFLAFIMLTEPLTTPPTRSWRMIYGALAGLLYGPFVHIGGIYSTPELTLVVSNVFSYIVSPKAALKLTLENIEKAGAGVYTFIFKPDKKMAFLPGQYLEWTLPHAKPDTRGNRRYFTIASSPTKNTLSLGVKFYQESSTFKKKLLDLQLGDTLMAGSLSGDFTLPKNPKTKLAFIAGGIGITPFKSMVEYMLDTKENKAERRDAVLFYSNKTAAEIAYKELFDTAEHEIGLKVSYTNTEETGFLTGEKIAETIPDFKERMFYLSGPRSMVEAFEKTLFAMGVSRLQIKTDFFPGFV
jgi:ferredoxin-NADP reductase/Na+-translocating ferredoxin:NAD+ oxidoreductase RnfD subunit